jgi:hypothetical protein
MREEGAILLNAQDNGGGAGSPARRRGDAVTATREDAGQIGPGPPKFLGEGGTSGRPSRRAEGDSQDESIYGEVIEVDGLLWKPRPEASSSSEEFRRARSLILEIDRDASWNPWVREDRAQEYEQAAAVFEQWTRAEPDFRPWSVEDLDAWMAARDAEFHANQAERDRQRAARVALYDAGWEQARLALLEQQAILGHRTEELHDLRERRRFPAMPEQRRREQIAELERSVAAGRSEVVRLQEAVGDVEAVVDERGWLPQERRELALTLFSARRCAEVQELRERVRERQARLRATKGRAERAAIREMLNRDRRRRQFLMAIPRLEAADMCSECVSPARWHGYVTSGANLHAGPCPAWPRWAQRIRKVREMIAAAVKDKPAEPPPPRPEPLAVVAPGCRSPR